MRQPKTPEQHQREMLAKAAKAKFRRYILNIATVAYIFGLIVGSLLTIWLWEFC